MLEEFLASNLAPPPNILGFDELNGDCVYDRSALCLSGVADDRFANHYPVRGRRTGGLFFMEDPSNGPKWASFHANQPWDFLISGAKWGERALESCPVRVYTAHQGVDPAIFFPTDQQPSLEGPIRVFSGGKYEYRKAQDVVLAAFAKFKEQHPTAELHANWYNGWGQSAKTMRQSPHIKPHNGDLSGDRELYHDIGSFGLRLGNDVKLYGRLSQGELASLIRACHMAVFPNRCEPGTNLVMMEAIACGVPTVSLNVSGQKDLENYVTIKTKHKGMAIAKTHIGKTLWPEPCVDAICNGMIEATPPDVPGAISAFSWAKECANAFLRNYTWEVRTRVLADILKLEMSR